MTNKSLRKSVRRNRILSRRDVVVVVHNPYQRWSVPQQKKKKQDKTDQRKVHVPFRRPKVMDVLGQGEISVEQILSNINICSIHDEFFQRFVFALEMTPFGNNAEVLCGALFQFVKKNLEQTGDDEIVVLGSTIRKLVFNLSDTKFVQLAELLEEAKKFSTGNTLSRIVKLFCKAIVDRFEADPHPYSSKFKELVIILNNIVEEYLNEESLKDIVTSASVVNAVLGVAILTDEKDILQELKTRLHSSAPQWLLELVLLRGNDIQMVVDQKIKDIEQRPQIREFFENFPTKREVF